MKSEGIIPDMVARKRVERAAHEAAMAKAAKERARQSSRVNPKRK